MDPQDPKGLVIPSSPVPPNAVAYIGGMNAMMRNYVLWKDGQMIVIQAKPLVSREDEMRPDKEYLGALTREFSLGLEYIHTLLHTIEFGKTNWAYLVPHKCGGYQLIQKEKRLHKVRCPTWAPLIEVKDITFTRWFDSSSWNGYWKGREVDVIMGYDDTFLIALELQMISHKLLQGLDVTYEVLAHVVKEDGSVIGLVTEPEVGRLIQYRDRALVYDAISRVQQRGLAYNAARPPNIHIFNGKVRLTNLAGLRYHADPVELEKKTALCHWEELEITFSFLDPNDFTPQPPWVRMWKQSLIIMPKLTSPERPLFVQFGAGLPKDDKEIRWTNYSSRRSLKKPINRRSRQNMAGVLSLELPAEALRTIKDAMESSPTTVRRHLKSQAFPIYHSRGRPALNRLLIKSAESGTEDSSRCAGGD